MLDTTVYETALKKRRAELLGELTDIEETLDETPPRDWEDRAAERQGDEVLEALGTHDIAELRRIEAALARIGAGTYGICQSCGNSIAEERLQALPATPLCAECAAAHEAG